MGRFLNIMCVVLVIGIRVCFCIGVVLLFYLVVLFISVRWMVLVWVWIFCRLICRLLAEVEVVSSRVVNGR